MLFTACHGSIWDAIDNLDARVARLEELCKEMNTNISSLQTIVSVLQENDCITGIVPVEKGGKVVGYTITFKKNQPITIYNGSDGKDGLNGLNGQDGKDGYTPILGVAQGSDGVYYWTLDGKWLLDDDGNKLRVTGRDGKDGQDGKNGVDGDDGKDGADGKDGKDGKDGIDGTNGTNGVDGKDGITPQLKIENNYWYISYDNGATWSELGKAIGEDGVNGSNGKDGQDGDSMFSKVTYDEKNAYLTLADGTVLTIPLGEGVWEKLEDLEERIAKLEELCKEMNTNIAALQTIVAALQEKDCITGVAPITKDGKTIGYVISFAKNDPITIYNGEDGKDGANGSNGVDGKDGVDGYTPILGVAKDTDGVYYWTLDGQWLLDVDGNKLDANIYAKANYLITTGLNLYTDLQYRHINYRINGINDEDLTPINLHKQYHFFNPKAGISYIHQFHTAYFNFAIANREPSRTNFTESGSNNIPLPERLYDYELGYQYLHKRWGIGANFYFMDYYNQLVLTGQYSDVGAYLTKNVSRSYRMGVELTAGVEITKWLRWDVNATFATNKIIDFSDWVDDWSANWNDPVVAKHGGQVLVNYGTTDISFSPNIIAGSNIQFHHAGFEANLLTNYVGRQYLDNTSNPNAMLNDYCVTNLRFAYILNFEQSEKFISVNSVNSVREKNNSSFPIKNISFFILINNLFNTQYESNGGVYSYFNGPDLNGNYLPHNQHHTPWYYPQAGINLHAGFTINF